VTYRLSEGVQEDRGSPESLAYVGTFESVSHIRIEVSLDENAVTFIEPVDYKGDGPVLVSPQPADLKAELDARRKKLTGNATVR
jgi:hypothetical protein